jgi:actin-related protein
LAAPWPIFFGAEMATTLPSLPSDSIKPSMIMDIGTTSTKFGLSHQNTAGGGGVGTFETMVSHVRFSPLFGSPQKRTIIGYPDERVTSSIYVNKYPIEHGMVTNWTECEHVWSECFRLCNVDASEQSVT